MTTLMTVDEARRLIELCREVDGKAVPRGIESRMYWTGEWERSDAPQAEAIMLWRAGFGALLDCAEWSLGVGDWEIADDSKPVPRHLEGFFAPLAEWADREHEGWREKR